MLKLRQFVLCNLQHDSARVKCNVSHVSSSASNGSIIRKKSFTHSPLYGKRSQMVSTLPASLSSQRLNNYDRVLVTRCTKKNGEGCCQFVFSRHFLNCIIIGFMREFTKPLFSHLLHNLHFFPTTEPVPTVRGQDENYLYQITC